MSTPNPDVVAVYTELLQQAIWNLRTRLRYGETVSAEEIIAYLNAIENIPTMLLKYGDWYVEENIDKKLIAYDGKWMGVGTSKLRRSLVDTLRRCRSGEFRG